MIVAALVAAVASHYSTADVRVNVSVPSAATLSSPSAAVPPSKPAPQRMPPKSPVSSDDTRSPILREPASSSSPTARSLEYDLLAARFNAVSTSLKERSKALNGLPVKPEISAALDACRRDLEAVRKDLAEHVADDGGTERLERVRQTLKYLESL
jgi:hypothetical protein